MSNVISKQAFFKKLGYKPHDGQILFHSSMARFRFANCGRRFGKSTMAARDLEPRLFVPNQNFWIVAPTYDLGEKEFRVIWQDLILDQKLGQDKRIRKSYSKKQGNMYIKFPWNTIVEVRSADHPENLVGDALDHVIMSEAAKHKQDTWERFIRPALADKRGTADFPTTPEGYNWLYDEWLHGLDKNFHDYASWRFPSWYNLEVFPGGENDPEIIKLRQSMSKESFIQEIGADFGSFSGKIYGDWDSAVNVANHTFNPAWKNYMAFDWGFTNPLAAIEFQVSPDDKIYVWREHYLSYTRLETHIELLKRRDNPPGYHLDMAFGDAADPEAAQTVSVSYIPCLALPEAKTNWRQGIDLVSKFISRECAQDEFGGPIYEPALFVDPSCTNTIKEFNNYKAPPGINGKNAQEIGYKQDDHAMDALRYGLVHIYELGANRHLSEVYDGASTAAVASYTPMDRNSGFSISSGPSSDSFFTTTGKTF